MTASVPQTAGSTQQVKAAWHRCPEPLTTVAALAELLVAIHSRSHDAHRLSDARLVTLQVVGKQQLVSPTNEWSLTGWPS